MVEPVKHLQCARVGPLQIVDEQHHRALRAPVVDHGDDRLGNRELPLGRTDREVHVGAACEQARHLIDPRVGGRLVNAQTATDGGERDALLEFLTESGQNTYVITFRD